MKPYEACLKRINQLRKKLRNNKIDGALITCNENIFYFSDFFGEDSQMLITQKSIYLFTDSRYTEQAENETENVELVITGGGDRLNQIEIVLKKERIKSLGIENKFLQLDEFQKYKKNFNVRKYLNVSNIINELRIIKDEIEIEYMTKGAAISDEVFLLLLKKIEIGMTEMDIMAEMAYLFNKRGCDFSFRPIIASGENSALPHAPITNRQIKSGDLLTLDFGCKFNHYSTDCTRTIAIGGLDSEQKKVYDIVKIAQNKAFDSIRPGISAKSVDSVAREYIKAQGYGDYFGHGLGHGVGLFIHEAPAVNPRSETILEPNMVVTNEPGIYLKGKYGVRIEDMCLVGEKAGISFNKLDRELLII